ncbi:hypothetical protein V8F06_001970 [Rhypophila decipiens]
MASESSQQCACLMAEPPIFLIHHSSRPKTKKKRFYPSFFLHCWYELHPSAWSTSFVAVCLELHPTPLPQCFPSPCPPVPLPSCPPTPVAPSPSSLPSGHPARAPRNDPNGIPFQLPAPRGRHFVLPMFFFRRSLLNGNTKC